MALIVSPSYDAAMRLLRRAFVISALCTYHLLGASLGWGLDKLRKLPQSERQRRLGARLATLCRRLGATFVKLAQILATRADILPDALRERLAELHERVGPFPYPLAHQTIVNELGATPEQIFAQFDPYPVASASVAQVHRARLPDGREVAVKVLRPGVEGLVATDLRIMAVWARILSVIPVVRRLSPIQVLAEFAHALERQLDLRIEAANNRRFREIFATHPRVRFPALVEEFCCQRVLTMDFIEGDGILQQAHTSEEARQDLARTGYRMVLEMVFEHGFVHADLHPGNMRVAGDKLVVFDLGLTAEVSSAQQSSLRRLCLAWARRDTGTICDELGELAFKGQPPRDAARLHLDVSKLLDHYGDLVLGEIQIGRLLIDLLLLVRRQWPALDPTFTMVAVSIAVVEGVARQLAPELRLMQEAVPFLTEIAVPPTDLQDRDTSPPGPLLN